MTMTMSDRRVDNGVNVEALLGAREALTAAPEAAQFHWRATCEWVNGTHSRSTVEDFFGLGAGAEAQDRVHASTPIIRRSSPPRTTARRRSSTCSSVWARCLTAGIAAVAQHRDIQLRSVTATLEGAMDIQGILGIDSDVRNGFDGIKVTYKIDADATPRGDQGARRPVAEALGRLRHRHQPDQRHGRGELTGRATLSRERVPCARSPPSSSAPAMPGWR